MNQEPYHLPLWPFVVAACLMLLVGLSGCAYLENASPVSLVAVTGLYIICLVLHYLQRKHVGYVVWVAVLVLITCLTGCASKPVTFTAPPEEAAKAAACEPLPLCGIPTGANSTQLEEALRACVLEYRSLYQVCYDMQHQEPQ
jgi:hypothetical protein